MSDKWFCVGTTQVGFHHSQTILDECTGTVALTFGYYNADGTFNSALLPVGWGECCCDSAGGGAAVTAEVVQDFVGSMLNADGFVYNDAGGRYDTTGAAGQVLTSNGAGGATWAAGGGGSAITVVDTTCVDLTLTGTVLSAAPIIAPSNGACLANGLACTPTGLWVAPNPVHVAAECEMPAVVVSPVCTGGVPAARPFSMTSIGTGFDGGNIVVDLGGNGTVSIAAPAISAVDEIYLLEVTWSSPQLGDPYSGLGNADTYIGYPLVGGTLGVQQWNILSDEPFYWFGGFGASSNPTAQHRVYWARGSSSNPAGTITVNFPNSSATSKAEFVVTAYKLTGVDPGAPFRQVASSKTDMLGNEPSQAPQPSLPGIVLLPSPPVCPTVFFVGGRHVRKSAPVEGSPFETPVGATTVTEYVPFPPGAFDSNGICNLGQEGGTNGTSGQFVWTANHNWYYSPPNQLQASSSATLAEVNCLDTQAAAVQRGATCTLNAVNPACNPNAVAELEVGGLGDGNYISAAPGNHFQVIYSVNGTDYIAAELDNSAGIAPIAMTFPPFNWSNGVGGTVAAGGAVATQTLQVKTRCVTFRDDPANAITLGAWRGELHLDHI